MSDDPFFRFLKEPTQENFLAVREIVLKHPSYMPYNKDLEEAANKLESQDWQGFIDAGQRLVPNYLLSPRFHLMRSYALKQIGDEESSEMEAAMCMICFEGIRGTGDGSLEKPWLVLRTLDEYDVLEQLGKTPKGQSLLKKNDRTVDRMECEDGEVFWFDITDAFAKLDTEFGDDE